MMREFTLFLHDEAERPDQLRGVVQYTSRDVRLKVDWPDQCGGYDGPMWQSVVGAMGDKLGGFRIVYCEYPGGKFAYVSADWGPRNSASVGNLGGRDLWDGDPAKMREFRDLLVKWLIEDVGGDPSWDEVGDAASRFRDQLSDRKAA